MALAAFRLGLVFLWPCQSITGWGITIQSLRKLVLRVVTLFDKVKQLILGHDKTFRGFVGSCSNYVW